MSSTDMLSRTGKEETKTGSTSCVTLPYWFKIDVNRDQTRPKRSSRSRSPNKTKVFLQTGCFFLHSCLQETLKVREEKKQEIWEQWSCKAGHVDWYLETNKRRHCEHHHRCRECLQWMEHDMCVPSQSTKPSKTTIPHTVTITLEHSDSSGYMSKICQPSELLKDVLGPLMTAENEDPLYVLPWLMEIGGSTLESPFALFADMLNWTVEKVSHLSSLPIADMPAPTCVFKLRNIHTLDSHQERITTPSFHDIVSAQPVQGSSLSSSSCS